MDWDESIKTENGYLYKFYGTKGCPLCGGTEFNVTEVKPKGAASGRMEILDGNKTENGDHCAVREVPDHSKDIDAVGDGSKHRLEHNS